MHHFLISKKINYFRIKKIVLRKLLFSFKKHFLLSYESYEALEPKTEIQ